MACFISLTVSTYTRTKSERQLLRENSQHNVANVHVTAPTHRNKTMLTHSMEAQHEAIGEVASKGNLHKAIKQAKKDPWAFKGSPDDVEESGVPQVFNKL